MISMEILLQFDVFAALLHLNVVSGANATADLSAPGKFYHPNSHIYLPMSDFCAEQSENDDLAYNKRRIYIHGERKLVVVYVPIQIHCLWLMLVQVHN